MAVMTMLLAAGFPSLGQSVLSRIESLQESVLKRTAQSSRSSQTEMQTSVHVSGLTDGFLCVRLCVNVFLWTHRRVRVCSSLRECVSLDSQTGSCVFVST